MVLRDIFLEVGEIFNFDFEKNQNGSYRVNTIIAKLVYPELYNEGNFTEGGICYFLKNSDFTYQHYPNIRNSFSELMKPKAGSNRFPVSEFADMLDINRMYTYYQNLANGLNEENVKKLDLFIEKIMLEEAMLHSRLKLFCRENYEFITWIILFSMFNEHTAEDKLKAYLDTVQEPVEVYSDKDLDNHKLSVSLQKITGRLNVLTALLLTSVCMQFVLIFVPQFTNISFGGSYYLFVFLYSFITIAIWILHALATYKATNLKTLFHFKSIYPDFEESDFTLKPDNKPHNSILEKKRQKFRRIFFPLCLFLCILALVPAIIIKSFPLFVGLVLISILSYLCADRIVSSYEYKTFYDSLTSKQLNKPYRGMAKIYKWEYEKTGFNFKDKYYKNTIPVHSNECYKNIFYLASDRNKWALINLYLLVVFINIYFLLITLLIRIIDDKFDFFKIPESIDINLLIIIYLATVGAFCIITALCNKNYFKAASMALHSLARIQKNPADAAKLYISMQSENILKEVDVARGVYVYNISRFEQGAFVEDIFPESDRMLYYHQAITYRTALNIFYWFAYGISVFILVWHMQNFIWFLPLTLVVLAMYLISRYAFIDRIHYHRLVREIKKLSSEK